MFSSKKIPGHWVYKYNNVDYYVPNFGYQFYLIDFDLSRKISKDDYINIDLINIILLLPARVNFLISYFLSILNFPENNLSIDKFFELIKTSYHNIYKKAISDVSNINPCFLKFINYKLKKDKKNIFKNKSKKLLLFIVTCKKISVDKVISNIILQDSPFKKYKFDPSVEILVEKYYNIFIYGKINLLTIR